MQKLWLASYIDDGICLDVVHIWIPDAQLLSISLSWAHYASRDRVLEGEGAANGNHKLARSQVCRAAQWQHRQLFLRKGEGMNIKREREQKAKPRK